MLLLVYGCRLKGAISINRIITATQFHEYFTVCSQYVYDFGVASNHCFVMVDVTYICGCLLCVLVITDNILIPYFWIS